MQSILGLPKRILRCFRRGSAVRTHTFSPVRKWDTYTGTDRQRIIYRLDRYAAQFHARYREKGLMRLPLRYEIRNGLQICVEDRPLPGKPLPAESVYRMRPEQIDIIIKSLLMQLRQLESIGFVHGAISPDTVKICQAPKAWSAAVTDITAGRFTDEQTCEENLVHTDCVSPEAFRAIRYPYANQIAQETDVFSAACLFYYFLTGNELMVGDSPVVPAEAVWLDLPIPLDGVYGFRASLIDWMLTSSQQDRPSAAAVLEAFREAEKNGILEETVPGVISLPDYTVCAEKLTEDAPVTCRFAYDKPGNGYIARILHRMWQNKAGAAGELFVRQEGYLSRETRRMNEVTRQSALWHSRHSGIDPCSWEASSPFPVCLSPVAGDTCIPLRRLYESEPSVFIRDARMTELLFMAKVLHDDDYIMGILSENSFYISVDPSGSSVHYADAVSAISLSSIPCSADLMPDRDELRIMSPEMSAFIATRSGTQVEAYQVNLGPASDVFALGMLYHLILTGKYPKVDTSTLFDENRPYGTYSNALCHASWPEETIVLDPSLDRKHSSLIRRMIAVNPLERISECDQIANLIMGFYTE